MAHALPGGVGARVVDRLPPAWRRGLTSRLTAAGDDRPGQLRVAIGARVLAAAFGVCAGAVTVAAVGARGGGGSGGGAGALGSAFGVLVALAVASLPEVHLRRRTASRRQSLRRHLPRLLDLLTISVEAGLGFDQALGRSLRAVPPPLSAEFARLQAEVLAGVPRSDALRALAQRCPIEELRSFSLAMTQVETFGVPVAPILRAQAEELRVRQRNDAQERAQKAPVKMLVPLATCVFPALLVVVAGPAILSIRAAFAT
jgi:tight adherence protein C